MYQKNKHIIDSLVLKNAPKFVYQQKPDPIEGEIPVFTFHLALPELFEEQCHFLSKNNYYTLSSYEFLHALTSTNRLPKKSILLTFDDGLKHVWTVAFPILKKYNFKATCFLIPGCISEQNYSVRPTLEDYWKGLTTLEKIVKLKDEKSALATWPEIKIMHESGVIDFHSHTMYHSLVFTSEKILDFIHPGYNTHFYGNIHVPLYSENGKDVITRDAVYGLPIYCSKPRMCAAQRYFDDERIRKKCIDFVKNQGGENFFKRKSWRIILKKIVRQTKKTEKYQGRFETREERETAIYNELIQSRKIIEEKLPGKKVTHLCYPWYTAEDFAVRASIKAGYKVNYFGTQKGKPTNRPNTDPFRVVRTENLFLQRLPGASRKKLRDLLKRKYNFRSIPGRLGF
jgi:hypothetical protein